MISSAPIQQIAYCLSAHVLIFQAGYTCQIGNVGLYCCPLDLEIDMTEETTTFPSVSLRKLRPEKPCKGTDNFKNLGLGRVPDRELEGVGLATLP